MRAIYALRTTFILFFLLFLIRLLVRNQWLALAVLLAIFGATNALGSEQPWIGALITIVNFGLLTLAVLRWGITALATAVLVAELLLIMPATVDLGTWYAGRTLLMVAIPIALAAWALSISWRPIAPRAT